MSGSAALRFFPLIGALFVAAGVAGCEDPNDRPAEWSYLHAAVVVPSCATASCHSSLAKKAGIVLEDADDSYELLLDEQFVIPGNAASALIFLLEGTERTRMPPDAPLPDADVELFRRWIIDGALR